VVLELHLAVGGVGRQLKGGDYIDLVAVFQIAQRGVVDRRKAGVGVGDDELVAAGGVLEEVKISHLLH
jgi:hypothetical protein